MLKLLLALQIFHVAFLLLHDWIPLGPLSDLAAVRAERPNTRLLLSTILSTIPFAIALGYCLYFGNQHWPHWLFMFLWIDYVLLFFGELRAWWFPFFGGSTPEQIASYERMFGATHAFLPPRNGIRINTLHVILHTATVVMLVALAIQTL